jgi:Outer membrane protein beta-barrel domain
MKKIISIAFCMAFLYVSVTAQSFRWGVKAGISTPDIKPADVVGGGIKTDSVSIGIGDANYGFHFGAFARLGAAKFFIQPELNLNSSKVTYNLKALKGPAIDSLQKESFLNLDIPVLLGVKLSSFRINGGPVAHLHLSNSTDLLKIKNFQYKFDQLQWGYQLGMGADFGKLGIDLRYEGNFNKFGDYITISGKSFNFAKTPSRLLASFAISF